jgi:hypothetical protein
MVIESIEFTKFSSLFVFNALRYFELMRANGLRVGGRNFPFNLRIEENKST